MQGPSKKVLYVSIIVAIVVVAIITTSIINKNKTTETLSISPKVLISQNPNQILLTDEDEDGLLDWEETIRLSDPKNPDTDGDGTLDGAEIKAGRNPTVAGPDDTLKETTLPKTDANKPIYEHYTPGTLSDQWSQNLIGNFLNNINNPEFTPEASQELFTKLVTDVDTMTDVKIDLKLEDVKTFDFNEDQVKEYGNSLAIINADYIKKLTETKNGDSKTYLNNISEVYYSTANLIMQLDVPAPLAAIHLEMAKNLIQVGESISTINNKSQTDPLLALFSIQNYNEAAESQTRMYTTVSKYFKDNGIIFESNEPGNIWNNI